MFEEKLKGEVLECEVEGKEWWQSRTVWFNVLALVLAVVAAVAGHFGFDEFEPGADWQEIIVLVVTVVNLILRYVTTRPINPILSGGPESE